MATLINVLGLLAPLIGVVASANATAPNPYFFILGDWGVARGTHGQQCQLDVAEKMKAYAKTRGVAPLLVAAVGDNFYATGMESNADWTDMWSNVYEPNTPSSGLYNVPWYAVLGNHDHGNGDPKCACGTCKQMSNYVDRPEETRLYNMPDYNWYKEFPSAGFEVIGVESNIWDIGGLGGNGMHASGANQVPIACGGEDAVKSFLQKKYDEGLALVKERAQKTTASVVLIIQHYPRYSNIPQELVAAFKEYNKNVTVISAYGHDHNQKCDEGPDSKCEHILSGGGGGYTGGPTYGFVAVHLDGQGGYSTMITDSDVTVKASDCSICDGLPNCLWASDPKPSSRNPQNWLYVAGAAALGTVASTAALAFGIRQRRQNVGSNDMPEAASAQPREVDA